MEEELQEQLKEESGKSKSRKLKTATQTDKRDSLRHRQLQTVKSLPQASYQKLGTPRKGEQHQPSNIRGSESVFIYKLVDRYVANDATPERIREQVELALQRKNSQIQALRVQRDELRFISYNSQYDTPIKMGLAVLKQKAKLQEKLRDMAQLLQRNTKQLESELNCMSDYHSYLTKAIRSKGEEDLMIDPQEQEKLMLDNLQKQTSYLLRELREEDKKNARQIRTMHEEIANFRVMIKQKEDWISDLKSKICTLHIKLHNRVGSTSRKKNVSLSIRKFNTKENQSIQEAFIGNGSFKHYSKETLERIEASQQLTKIVLWFDTKKELLAFRCVYGNIQGIIHSHAEDPSPLNFPKDQDSSLTEIIVKQMLSIKFYFKSKIVGVECRLKSDKGAERIRVGNCSSNLQHELLTLINKRVVTLGSYEYQKEMIGVGVWYCSRLPASSSRERAIRTVKSGKKPIKSQVISEYYMG